MSTSTLMLWLWRRDDFPPIDTTDFVVRIPARFLTHSGLKPPNRAADLLLYKRQAMEQQWQAIQRDTIQRSSVLSIVGAPGSGKPCGAYAFACGLVDRTKWIVVWLHFVPRGDGFLCVKLDGNSKTTAKWMPNGDHWDPQTLFGVAEHETRGLVVFVDGYSDDEKTCVSTFNALKAWSWEDTNRRRLVCVASAASVAMWRRSIAIAHHDESMLLGEEISKETMTMEDTSGADFCSESDREGLFRLMSWRLEEYYQAVESDELYAGSSGALWQPEDRHRIRRNAPTAVVSIEARRTLVDIKYRLAAGSAAMMFTLSTRQIVSILERALSAVGNVRDLLSGSILSSAVAHALLAWYDGDGNATGTRPRLVSALSARLVATIVVPAAINEFKLAFAVNPSMESRELLSGSPKQRALL